MTLAVHRATAVVAVGSTVPRVHPAHLAFGLGHIGMRRLPLHADHELKHQQRCNHPNCEPVTHDPQRTPPAAMREEARLCREFQCTAMSAATEVLSIAGR
jgi:hypothetical protein